MVRLLHNSNKQVDRKGISPDSSTDYAFKRLAAVLLEIAESTITKEPILSDNPKTPSGRSSRKALKTKKEVKG